MAHYKYILEYANLRKRSRGFFICLGFLFVLSSFGVIFCLVGWFWVVFFWGVYLVIRQIYLSL